MANIIDIIKAEITNDPLRRGYVSMTDQQLLADGHALIRTRNRTGMTASEVLNNIDVTEFNALSATQERQIWDVLHIGAVNPFGVEAMIFRSVFGAGSTTIANLAAARLETISRWTELGLGKVGLGHIQEARRPARRP